MKFSWILFFLCLITSSNIIAQKLEIGVENGTKFIIDKTTSKYKKLEYNAIYNCAFSKDYVIAENNNLFLANLVTGKIIELVEYPENIKLVNDTSLMENGDFLRFREKGKVGLIKLPGTIILPAEYNEICPKADGATFFLLRKGKYWQFFFPQNGKFSASFTEMNSSSLYLDNGYSYLPGNEAVPVRVGSAIHLMKADGTDYTLDILFSKSKDFSIDGMTMILTVKDGKYGYIDQNANILVPFIYEWAEPMQGDAIVKYQGKFGVIREDGLLVIPHVYDMIKRDIPDAFQAEKEGKVIKISQNGNSIEELMPYQENNKYGFITEEQTHRITAEYDSVKPFNYGLAPVKKEGKWAYIIPTGHIAIPFQFEVAEPLNVHGFAPVKLDGKWGIIDKSGKFICNPEFDSIIRQNDIVRLLNNTGVYEFGQDRQLKLLEVVSEKGSMIDSRNNKMYKTVRIGQQIWFAQNLDFKTDESYSYNNNEQNAGTYGRLYTWKSALEACPPGWHLPSDEDWKNLERTLGMSETEVNSTDYHRGYGQSPMFKPGGSIGFDILMTGFLHGYDNNFYKIGEVCITWTSTSSGIDYAYTRSFFPDSNMLNRNDNTFKLYALPVRCLKN